MPNLLIYNPGNGWVIEVANTNFSFAFLGSTPATQATAVQGMAQAMAAGEEALVGGLGFVLDVPAGVSDQSVVTGLFNGTDALIYGGETIFSVDEGSSLLAELTEAGGALMDVVG